MKKIALFFVLISLAAINSGYTSCYPLDWKHLHEEADRISFTEAQAAVKMKPDCIEELYVLALAYLNVHKDKEAQDIFNMILALKPDVQEAKWGLAEVLCREHNLKKSEEIILGVIRTNPDFPPPYLTLAYIKYMQLDFNESVRLAYKIIEMGLDKVDRSNYVRAYVVLGGAKGIIAHYGGPVSKVINGTAVMPNLKAAEQLQPDSPEVMFGMGSFYLLAPRLVGGDLAKAEKYLKKGIQIDPLFTDIYVRLAQLYKIKGDKEKYNFYLNKASEIDPQSELLLDVKSGKCKFICPTGKESN